MHRYDEIIKKLPQAQRFVFEDIYRRVQGIEDLIKWIALLVIGTLVTGAIGLLFALKK